MEKRARIDRELPADLLFEILAKLPLKSLCRFRCVSKLWRSVIADPQFVEAQRACNEPRLESIILFPGCEKAGFRKPIYHAYTCNFDAPVDEYYDEHGYELSSFHELVPHQNQAIFGGLMSHQIGGLYCLDFGDSVVVWNPSTRESFDISTVETGKVDRYSQKMKERTNSINLFGYDPVEKKHKVLSISADLRTKKAFRSRVFILEENRWRTLADVYPLEAAGLRFICVNGVIFSAPFQARLTGDPLVAFHVGSETFQVIPLPQGANSNCNSLVELSGRATLVERDFLSHGHSETIRMWVLEDLHQPVWRPKTYSFPYHLAWRIPRCGTPTGELLFWGGRELGSLKLLLYNVENRKLRRIVVKLPSEYRGKQGEPLIRFHVESVQSPKAASS